MLDEKLGDLDSNLESSSNILGDLFFIRFNIRPFSMVLLLAAVGQEIFFSSILL